LVELSNDLMGLGPDPGGPIGCICENGAGDEGGDGRNEVH
jgi:hypothetical protein